jgi:hypothetical protein
VATYAIISKDDGLLDVVDTTGDEALEYASTMGYGDAWFDGPEEWLGYAELPLAANKKRTVAEMQKDPLQSLARSHLPQISLDEVLAKYPKRDMDRTDNQDPGLIAAHRDLVGLFPTERGKLDVRNVDLWQTPKGMVMGMLAQNAKLKKKPGKEFPAYIKRQIEGRPMPEAWGLALAPYSMGFNAKLVDRVNPAREYQLGTKGTLCLRKTPECGSSCLVYSGQNNIDVYNYVIKFAKTRALIKQPLAFCRVLLDAVGRHARRETPHRGKPIWPFIRLNVFSDIPWELVFPDLFRIYPGVSFYDYTKVPARDPEREGVEYDLTFSYSGRNREEMLYELTRRPASKRKRVAVVFATEKHELPRFAWGVPVVDADVSDFRPLDPPNPGTGSRTPVICGLAYKDPFGNMKAKQLKTIGIFVVPASVEEDGNVTIAERPAQTDIQNLSEHAFTTGEHRKLRKAGVERKLYLV